MSARLAAVAASTPAHLAAAAAAGGLAAVLLARLRFAAAPQCEECAPPDADDVDGWLALAHRERLARRLTPSQSFFRVLAIVVYEVENELRHVVGHNDEACCLLNSCCGERAAFLQLAGRAGVSVRACYITTDAPYPVTSGALCREYMLSQSWLTTPEMPVVTEGGDGRRYTRTLAELYPYASPYTRLDSAEQLAFGKIAAPAARAAMERAAGTPAGVAWRAATEAAERLAAAGDALHPLSFGAAAVLADGRVVAAAQRKALEYGCSQDAVCQLLALIDDRGSAPAVVAHCDQFALCHAPFAPARALLVEGGFGDAVVLCHAGKGDGAPEEVKAEALLPALPLIPKLGGASSP